LLSNYDLKHDAASIRSRILQSRITMTSKMHLVLEQWCKRRRKVWSGVTIFDPKLRCLVKFL